MKWMELPHRYQGAEVGAVTFGIVGLALGWNLEATKDAAQYIVNTTMCGLAFGYATGALVDGMGLLASMGNRLPKEGKLVEKNR